MTAERREDDAARLLLEALDRPSDERAAFLDDACAGDAELRAELDSLMEAHERAGDFLERMDLERAAALVESLPEPAPEGIIGAYRLIRELGRGGMGVVYLAERADGQFEQRVALKLLKRGMDSDEILRRFLLERQILARLQHPNIAALLDGGVSEQGQPYFAMEHVDGLQLLDYCDRHRLGVAARLRLFDEIGRAVRHAHQNLIVHRDLKPSNILVTAAGQVKLLDFGIAKLIDTSDGSGAATLTATGLRLVTPEYGSPEQLRGEPVTTSTDIYALGVILYELLTGRRPHTFSERTPEALARLAGAAEPSRPSTAVLHAA
ncbi:MAG TPA: serine/threonine-protein kinase, partial [Candidatus Saccharimonadales bacterium]|nr:serine/threonine-protein kinase [Candidatus Saccharimonadales bacterium]